jgi:glycerophosphoryl diester phosphodiesterase
MPLVIAHRGASAVERENTLDAFSRAAELGADWVELDVRTSGDGDLVVHHDPQLADGRVVAHTPVAVLPSWLPTLDAALDGCARHGLGVNVEIKALPGEPDEDRAIELADAVGAVLVDRLATGALHRDRLLVTCFDPRTIARVRAVTDGALPTGLLSLLLEGWEQVVRTAADGGHQAVNPWDLAFAPELVEAAHGAGLAVNVWTVDDPERLSWLCDIGVDGLITNVPDVGRAVVDRSC